MRAGDTDVYGFRFSECVEKSAWDAVVQENGGHPLQLWGWGETKSAHRWNVARYFVEDASGELCVAFQVLLRRLPFPFGQFAYVPRGPVFVSRKCAQPAVRTQVLDAIGKFLRAHYSGVGVSLEPDEQRGELQFSSLWREGKNPVLPARTLILDLTRDEEELFGALSKKHRQYVRKSQREGLEIRQVTTSAQLDECLEVYRATSARADFGLHEDSYYHDVFRFLGENSPVWAAYYEGAPVAFLFMAYSARTAFELYGGMNDVGQRLRANYALKWHVICEMRARGCARYDFGGLINDGVTTFKKGWAQHEDLLAGTWDMPGRFYRLWTVGVPFAKRVLRSLRGFRRS